MKKLVILVTLFSFMFVCFACTNEKAKREEVRGKLDAEFEKETKEIKEKAAEVTALLDELIKEHKGMDKKHTELDALLKDKQVEPKDKQLQEKHIKWDKQHLNIIKQAEKLLNGFEVRKKEHEHMEATHETASIEEIKKEHEAFEDDLKKFAGKFGDTLKKLQTAQKQMETIFKEHDILKKKYGEKK